MNIIDIIIKKKNKEELTKEEIEFVINNYIYNKIEDYQMSSLLMAIVLNGMTFDETYNLTMSMMKSGEIIDLSLIDGIKVDKHSTGGVGDKTSLVALPLAASLGVKIPKMSGRGLGYTGGTIDKLESITGFRTSLSKEEFIKNVNEINIAITSQSGGIALADKKIYALRDVTGTVESIPLIASSIMSKKLASGSDKILLDVKVGKGAFMKNLDDARELASTMVEIGKRYNKETIAILTNMDYPLGNTIGNSLEVLEAIDTLSNNGDEGFTKLCLIVSSYMVSMCKNISLDDAFEEVNRSFKNKDGLNKFKEFVERQGGDINNIKKTDNYISLLADKEGYLTDIDTLALANFCNSIGAGRKTKNDTINPKVGIKLMKRINDYVKPGESLAQVYIEENIDIKNLNNYFTITDNKKEENTIVYEVIK